MLYEVITDRRVEQLIDPALSGHPAFLVENSGLNSGFMMAHVGERVARHKRLRKT